MISYIIKTILCSASLYAIYYLLLEREKIYRFNRFYLLFSILFSFTVSFITIKVAAPIMPAEETIVLTNNSLSALPTTIVLTPIKTSDYLAFLFPAFYFIITILLLLRFAYNLTKLLSKTRGNKIVNYAGARLVLTSNNVIPFSFLNYIFINKQKYEKGTIEKEVLQHELTHVRQMHSLDVILIELFIAFAWFNPLLYLFRRSILLNHEFLADESVVETFQDARSYQLLLFKKANRKNNLMLSSSFNYLITKKRLIMMTRKTSQKIAIVKQIAIIPLITTLGFIYSTKVVAQDNTNLSKQNQTEVIKKDAVKAVQKKVKPEQKQVSKSLLDQKVKLDKEQQAEMLEQKVKMEKEMQAMTKEQKAMRKDQAKMLQQKVKMEKEMQAMTKEQKAMMKDRQAKITDQKIKMDKEMQVRMKKQGVKMEIQEAKMKIQEAKMKEQKAKMEQEQKTVQESK